MDLNDDRVDLKMHVGAKRVGRREAIAVMGAAGAAAVFGCADSPTSPTGTTTTGSGTNGACAVTPTETIGPFPSLTDLLRSDVREDRTGTRLTLIIKVVNACSFAGGPRYWVFAGGLTNVQVVLTVTDTQSGVTKTYTNPQGTAFAPIQDTNAFATCP